MSCEISIIIPLYNKTEFIERTLRSVVNQTIHNWECIIVDDGSTDTSNEKVRDFIRLNPGDWKLVTQKNSGQTNARNVGIGLAIGKYLAFLDADDLWVNDKLSSQFNYLEKNNDVFGVISSYAIFQDGFKRVRVFSGKNFNSILHNWVTMRGFGAGFESVGMIRYKGLPGEAKFDENLSTSSGLDFSIRCAQNGKMVSLRKIGLLYRISEGQWHADPKALKLNMAIISQRYSDFFGELLDTRHQAYFYWMDVRRRGRKHFLQGIILSLAFLRLGRVEMLFWLLFRNLVALATGRRHKKYVQTQLRLLND